MELRLLVALRLVLVLGFGAWATAERVHLPDGCPERSGSVRYAHGPGTGERLAPPLSDGDRSPADDGLAGGGRADDLAADPHGVTTTRSPHAGQRTSTMRRCSFRERRI